jgi:DNA-binding response OmpR family regulator
MATILVVDDTQLAREAVSKLLEHEGFRVMSAKNGREGWAMMYNDTPDLILLDLMMPEMDGVTFLKMLRRSPLWKDMPVIVLTGVSDDDKLITRAWELKVSDLIPKATFGVEDLMARVKQNLPVGAA